MLVATPPFSFLLLFFTVIFWGTVRKTEGILIRTKHTRSFLKKLFLKIAGIF